MMEFSATPNEDFIDCTTLIYLCRYLKKEAFEVLGDLEFYMLMKVPLIAIVDKETQDYILNRFQEVKKNTALVAHAAIIVRKDKQRKDTHYWITN